MLNAVDVRIEPSNTRGWPKTARQLDWANFHILDGLSTYQAALKAGYTENTAKAKSYELPNKLLPFLGALQERKNHIAEAQFEVTTREIVERLSAIALANCLDYVREAEMADGSVRLVGKPPNELSARVSFAVKNWTVTALEGVTSTVLDYRYVLHDKSKALRDLAKHLGMFDQKIQLQMYHQRTQRQQADYSAVPTELLEQYISAAKQIRDFVRSKSC